MPLSMCPSIRALQEALESEGLIKTLDSVAVTQLKALESAGTRPKVVPVQQVRIFRGTKYTAT